jgi:protein deglycase
MGTHALTILADGFEEIEAITPIDLLRRAGINVTVLGLNSRDVRGSHDIVVSAALLLDDFTGPYNALILPGGPGHKNLFNSQKVIDLVQSAFKKNLLCAAICAAPSILGKAGILENKKATCFPGYEDKLCGAIYVEKKTVVDGNIITSRGAGTAVDFSLEIIAYLAGPQKAEAVAKQIVYR